MTDQEPSIVIDHPHPFFNGLAKKHTTIKHLDGSTFEMAYTLTLPPAGVTPTGQRILLIQGFLAPGAPWRAAATDLAALGHEALFFDHAGIGHSTYPTSKPWRMTTRRYAAHVRQLLDNVWGNGTEGSGGHFHIAAISMGGMIAQVSILLFSFSCQEFLSLFLYQDHGIFKTFSTRPYIAAMTGLEPSPPFKGYYHSDSQRHVDKGGAPFFVAFG